MMTKPRNRWRLMLKNLIKTGNSEALVLNKDMKAHLGITDGAVEVTYEAGRIVLTRPVKKLSFEEALADVTSQYGNSLQNLASK
jgi:antitoxin component of MazEF toxin-antitoxin module